MMEHVSRVGKARGWGVSDGWVERADSLVNIEGERNGVSEPAWAGGGVSGMGEAHVVVD